MLHRRRVKGVQMSMEVIVGAALVLLVLVVLSMILLNRAGVFSKGLSACNGVCVKLGEKCPVNQAPVPTANCKDASGQVIEDGACCVAVG